MNDDKIIENKYRYLISKKKFNKLLNYAYEKLQIIPSDIQISYFYDDDMFSLSENDISLRVKQTGQSLELQIENFILSQDVLPEKEAENKFIQTLPNIIQKYSLRGSLVTRRRSFKFSEQFKLNLDENFYLGCIDFEAVMMIEKNCNNQQINDIVSKLALDCSFQTEEKASRYFKKLHEIKNLSL